MVQKRVTPIEEFERFAERLYNKYPWIQTKLDFDKSFDDMMEDAPVKPQALRDKAWDIIKTDYIVDYRESKDIELTKEQFKNKLEKKHKIKVHKVSLPREFIAKVWNPKLKHYQIKYVARVIDKNGRVRYFNGKQFVKVEKVKKVENFMAKLS